MSTAEPRGGVGSFLQGMAAGMLVGGAVTWLFTPYSGSQLRQMLQQRWRSAKHQAHHVVSSVQAQGHTTYIQAQSTARVVLGGNSSPVTPEQ